MHTCIHSRSPRVSVCVANRDEDLTLPLLDYSRGYLRTNEAALCLPRACTTPRIDILLFASRRTIVAHAKEPEGRGPSAPRGGLRSTDYQISLAEPATAFPAALVIRMPVYDPGVVSRFGRTTLERSQRIIFFFYFCRSSS